MKRDSLGGITTIAQAENAAGGEYINIGGWGFSTAVNQGKIYYNRQQVVSFVDGNTNVVHEGSIESVDLTTGQQTTVVSGLASSSGLAFDPAGNLYYASGARGASDSFTANLMKRDVNGNITDLGKIVDTSPGTIVDNWSALSIATVKPQVVCLAFGKAAPFAIKRNEVLGQHVYTHDDSPTASMAAAAVDPSYKAALMQQVKDIYHHSGIDNVVFTDTPTPEAATVYFVNPINLPSDQSILLGQAYDGIDRFNKKSNDRVVVFVTGLATTDAKTSAHEVGHALGLRHVDPGPNEVMSYEAPATHRSSLSTTSRRSLTLARRIHITQTIT